MINLSSIKLSSIALNEEALRDSSVAEIFKYTASLTQF